MGKLSLKVVVAGRTYPLTVNSGEEAKVTKAAEDINKAIKMLQDNYAVKDMQDLLAMTALQLATKSTNTTVSAPVEPDYSEIESKLNELSTEIDSLK
jgi:cell division protein ZapA (FtsZ GTPase activity inhibitor)